jgi:hypothetical protein
MYGGSGASRDTSWAVGLRRGPWRAGLSASLVAVLAAALVAGGREPSHDLLATAPVPPSDQAPDPSTTPPTPPVRLPDPTGREVKGPASPSRPDRLAPASAQGIPQVALAAYQRSALVINAADPSCRLDWSLLGAIGQVESDHGQFAGSSLDGDGIAHPDIVGPRLDGRHGTSVVRDTDAGRLDGDRRFDRAVGPMQFIPSTWATYGRGDVHDPHQAILAAARFLRAAGAPRDEAGALHRYNPSWAYVDAVRRLAGRIRRSPRAFAGYYARRLIVRTPGGYRRLT